MEGLEESQNSSDNQINDIKPQKVQGNNVKQKFKVTVKDHSKLNMNVSAIPINYNKKRLNSPKASVEYQEENISNDSNRDKQDIKKLYQEFEKCSAQNSEKEESSLLEKNGSSDNQPQNLIKEKVNKPKRVSFGSDGSIKEINESKNPKKVPENDQKNINKEETSKANVNKKKNASLNSKAIENPAKQKKRYTKDTQNSKGYYVKEYNLRSKNTNRKISQNFDISPDEDEMYTRKKVTKKYTNSTTICYSGLDTPDWDIQFGLIDSQLDGDYVLLDEYVDGFKYLILKGKTRTPKVQFAQANGAMIVDYSFVIKSIEAGELQPFDCFENKIYPQEGERHGKLFDKMLFHLVDEVYGPMFNKAEMRKLIITAGGKVNSDIDSADIIIYDNNSRLSVTSKQEVTYDRKVSLNHLWVFDSLQKYRRLEFVNYELR